MLRFRGVRLTVECCRGLEAMLERELLALSIQCHSISRVVGGVEVEASESAMWTAALRSRIAESVHVHMGDSFVSIYENMLHSRLPHLPWDSFFSLRQGDPLPLVRVKTESSRIYHTALVKNAVLTALE